MNPEPRLCRQARSRARASWRHGGIRACTLRHVVTTSWRMGVAPCHLARRHPPPPSWDAGAPCRACFAGGQGAGPADETCPRCLVRHARDVMDGSGSTRARGRSMTARSVFPSAVSAFPSPGDGPHPARPVGDGMRNRDAWAWWGGSETIIHAFVFFGLLCSAFVSISIYLYLYMYVYDFDGSCWHARPRQGPPSLSSAAAESSRFHLSSR
ncbi:hypothetical protein VTK73DRAFT_4020 [Phialemonium thermophilum]|uniref:Uncharacterized protein n=1 Tax=Phialemonium thermophilum TaxID=223376 RepID=A0ABR3VDP1_9PEZI